jgi:hypothetical protein
MKSLMLIAQIMLNIFSFHIQRDSTDLNSLLDSYYDVKNALINSDAPAAATKAAEFIRASNSFEMKTLPAGKANDFIVLQKNLIADAEYIKATKDIVKQRDYFAAFSRDFYALAKTLKVSGHPVYQQYCPMKKMYWLSSEPGIKNPYYGNAMLTCGRVTETINP